MQKILLSRLQNNRGSILLLTYFVTIILFAFGAAFLVMGAAEIRRAEIQHKADLAFYIAEAGIEQVLYELKDEYESGDKDWTDDITIDGNVHTVVADDYDNFYAVYTNETYPDPANDYTQSYSNTANNKYSVSLRNITGEQDLWIRSTGEVDGVKQTIQVYVRVINVSPWNNAIFGGAGASGSMVSGDVDIFGSVHILGDGLNPGDNAIVLSGNSDLVGNYYKIGPTDLPQALKDKIPDLPTTILNEGTAEEETVETLSAELRVKKGIVSLSGNSAVGEPDDTTGNTVKEMIDGAYVTDGYAGTKGATNVFSDNGTNEGYDLGDAVKFPSLSDNYPGTSVDYYSYFTTHGLVLSAGELSDLDPSDIVTLGDCADDCVTTDGAGNIRVEGMIYISGTDDDNDLQLSGGDFNYTGKGTILVAGDVTIASNFQTFGNDSFPTNIIGIMTPNDINLGVSSQKDIMGLFFAEGTVATDMQTNIVGTIFTNFFDVGDQTPGVFQVPLDEDDYPDGLISDEDIWFTKIVSWQKCDGHTATCGGV